MRLKAREIKFDESGNFEKVQLLKAATYEYYDNTKLEISSDVLRSMKKNFDNNVLKIDIAIDYAHMSGLEAAGWVKSVELENNDTELWLTVDWTETAKAKVLDREYRYLSADFDMNYRDNESGEEFGATLKGGGLTNRPFVKGMNPILSDIAALVDKNPEKVEHIHRILLSDPKKGNEPMKFTELLAACAAITLSASEKSQLANVVGIEDKSVQLNEQIVSLKAELKEQKEKNVELSDKVATAQKEIQFSELLDAGKAVPAQKEAFLAGDTVKFAELAEVGKKVNLSSEGSGAGDEGDDETEEKVETREDAEDKVMKLAEAKRKEDKELSVAQSINIVLSENAELKKLINA